MDRKTLYRMIRDEVIQAAARQGKQAPFNLSGRGHELRVTLDRHFASILRDCDLPRITISGFGANNFYPARVFHEASENLRTRLSWNIMIFSNGCVSIVDVNEHIIETHPSSKRARKIKKIGTTLPIRSESDDVNYRKVFVVIKQWPSGTQGYKVGSAIKKGLRIESHQLKLIQLGPERVFSAMTKVSSSDFLKSLEKSELGTGSNISIFDENSESGNSFRLWEKVESDNQTGGSE